MDAHLLRVTPDRGWTILEDTEVAREIEAAQGSKRVLDVAEAWAGLHFLLTGEMPTIKEDAIRLGISWDDDSLENVLMGGQPTRLNSSYGPVRFLGANDVVRMAAKLAEVTEKDISDRYDPVVLTEEQIPPYEWDNEFESRDWLVSSYAKLNEFYQVAATEKAGLLIYLI